MTHPMLEQLTAVSNYPEDFPEKFCEWMLEDAEDGDDVERFWLCDLFIKMVGERRKFSNKRLLNLEKAWALRKEHLKPQIVKIIEKLDTEKKSYRVLGGGGTVSKVRAKQKKASIKDEQAAMEWLMTVQCIHQPLPQLANNQEGFFKLEVKLTDEGKRRLLALASTGHAPTGTTYDYPADTVSVTRKQSTNNELIENMIQTSLFGDERDHILLDDMPDFESQVGVTEDD